MRVGTHSHVGPAFDPQSRGVRMRRLITLLMLAAFACGAAAGAARADDLLFDYVGFDYETPNNNPGQFGEVGSTYVGLGTVPFLFAPLTSNTAVNEYTYVMTGNISANIDMGGGNRLVTISGGSISIYEDPKVGGTVGTFGTLPPNATAPSSFTDGLKILEGTLTNFQFLVHGSTGEFEAVFTVVGGSQLANFTGQTTGWTFAGATGNALNIPQGYQHQIDGQTFLNTPVSTRRTSWGKLKEAYR